jgi:hypothetical protein
MSISIQNYKIMYSGLPFQEICPFNKPSLFEFHPLPPKKTFSEGLPVLIFTKSLK